MCYLNWFWNSPLCRGSFHPETIPAGAAGETVLTTYRKAAEQSNTVSPRHCFQETSGRFSPFLAAKTLDCRFKQDTWPTVTRGFCADAKTEDELGVLTTRLETEPKETKFVTYRNKSVGCWRCSVDMCVFVFCIPTGYITLNWQWQNLKYQNTVD